MTPVRSHPLVRYLDEHVVVAAKPPGVAARAATPGEQDGLADLLARAPALHLGHGLLRLVWAPAPPDSGLCVLARTDRSAARLSGDLESGRLKVKFEAVSLAHAHASAPFALPAQWRHAAGVDLRHPVSGERLALAEPAPPSAVAARSGEAGPARLSVLRARERRVGVIDPALTDAFRLIHGASDGVADHLVDSWAGVLLVGHRGQLADELVRALAAVAQPRAIFARALRRDVRSTGRGESAPVLVHGEAPPDRFPVRESGLTYLASMREGTSSGLFLDQRESRAWLRGLVEPGARVLNVFAYTCAFSLCAAAGGAVATSLDLSKRYLDWGRENFTASGQDPERHDWIFGDAFDWLARLARKERRFEVVILDPPTFSTAKSSGPFSAEKDYRRLAALAIPLVAPGGRLVASTNAGRLSPARFAGELSAACRAAGRSIGNVRLTTQSADFPASPAEPAYLKVWSAVI